MVSPDRLLAASLMVWSDHGRPHVRGPNQSGAGFSFGTCATLHSVDPLESSPNRAIADTHETPAGITRGAGSPHGRKSPVRQAERGAPSSPSLSTSSQSPSASLRSDSPVASARASLACKRGPERLIERTSRLTASGSRSRAASPIAGPSTRRWVESHHRREQQQQGTLLLLGGHNFNHLERRIALRNLDLCERPPRAAVRRGTQRPKAVSAADVAVLFARVLPAGSRR